MNNKLIIALDLPTLNEAINFTNKIGSQLKFVKIGMELFYKEGDRAVKTFQDKGLNVFLDLKLHDIPNTVEHAIKSLVELNPTFTTLHALGGPQMLSAAAAAIENFNTKLLGVTILTSHSQEFFNNELGIPGTIQNKVIQLAKMSIKSGMDGVVASPIEAKELRANLSKKSLIVTPGVRFDLNNLFDQKRVLTPKESIQAGATHLVIGREITKANDPMKIFEKILRSIS